MRRVILSVHKNYIVLLASLYGIGLAFFLMWWYRLGERLENLQQLLFAGLLFGPPVGILHVSFIGIIGLVVSRILAVQVRLPDFLAVTAYAAVPVILGAVFILPVEIVTFGQFLFTQNPSPIVIKPVSYIILMTLDALTILWSVIVLVIGVSILGEVRVWKSILIVGLTIAVSFLLLLFIVRGVV